MPQVVEDAYGLACELVPAAEARGQGLLGSDEVRFISEGRDQEAALIAALVEIGRLPPDAEPPGIDAVRDMVEQAFADGALVLRRARLPHPPGAIVDPGEPQPLVPPDDDDDDVVEESHTLDIELIDPDGNPVPGAAFKVRLSDGEIRHGHLNDQGQASLGDIHSSGDCEVTFTAYDQDAWGPV